jgi:hypothetical protein
MKEITDEKLDKYFSVTKEALKMAEESGVKINTGDARGKFLDMVTRYVKDAQHFRDKNDYINAFAALNYAHGWLDAGAVLGIFDVHNSRLFTVDDLE